jgi:hypothetical protein
MSLNADSLHQNQCSLVIPIEPFDKFPETFSGVIGFKALPLMHGSEAPE